MGVIALAIMPSLAPASATTINTMRRSDDGGIGNCHTSSDEGRKARTLVKNSCGANYQKTTIEYSSPMYLAVEGSHMKVLK